MKCIGILVLFLTAAVWAQTEPAAAPDPLAKLSDSEKIAQFDDGTFLTAGQFRGYLAVLDPSKQPIAARKPETLIEEIAFMRKLAAMAEQEKLDQRSPAREQLAFNRLLLLTQIKVEDATNQTQVDANEILNYYNSHKDKYKQVKVNAIYVAFGDSSAGGKSKPTLTEEQAKAKAARLLAQLRGGADFAKLAKENSDDETSKDKDGYFATLNPGDNIPDAFRVVFQLKQGDITEPVRQANGFYLLKAEVVSVRPLSQVRDQIYSDLKQEHFRAWLDKVRTDTKVQYPSPDFQPQTKPAAPAGAK